MLSNSFCIFFYSLDLHCCFHGIQPVYWCDFVNRWEQIVTDGLMMISHNKGSLLSYGPLSIQKHVHTPPVLIFFSQFTLYFNSSFIHSKYWRYSICILRPGPQIESVCKQHHFSCSHLVGLILFSPSFSIRLHVENEKGHGMKVRQ